MSGTPRAVAAMREALTTRRDTADQKLEQAMERFGLAIGDPYAASDTARAQGERSAYEIALTLLDDLEKGLN